MNHCIILLNVLFDDQSGTMVKIKIISNCTSIINYKFDHCRVFSRLVISSTHIFLSSSR